MKDNKLTCLIVEDEPIAAEVLKDYVYEISFLTLKGICSDAIFALEKMNEEHIDVIFLDIHLPKVKGLEFLKILKVKPQVILTTAYHQYAIDAFDEGVVDYLLKPIEFSRFLKAVNKLKRDQQATQYSKAIPTQENNPFHFFNVNKKKVRVNFDDVLYIESLKDYCKIITKDNTLVTRGQIGQMESVFDPEKFVRIHRSFMVAIDKVDSYSSSEIGIYETSLPIGRSYRELVAQKLDLLSSKNKP